MIRVDLADKILRYYVNKSGEWDLGEIWKTCEMTPDMLFVTIEEMQRVHPHWFQVIYDPNKLKSDIYPKPGYHDEMHAWLRNGGYKQYIDQIEKAKKDQEELHQLNRENLIVSTKQAQHAIKNYKWTKWLSIISIIMALISLIISFLK